MAKSTLWRLLVLFLLCVMFSQARFANAQTVTSFEGIDASQVAKPEFDVDPNGAIGTKQYMEWVNPYYQAWSKTSPFAAVWSKPQGGTAPFVANGVTNCAQIEGDGIVTFDRLASRWIIAGHNAGQTTYYYCVAISNTDDLSAANLKWFTYAFPLDNVLGTNSQGTIYFPDWPKFGVWPDAYYLGVDIQDPNDAFQEVGVIACAFDRADMLIGATALPPQCFRTPTSGSGLFLGHSLQPADVEGTTAPPAGSPEYFVSIENPVNDGVTTTSDTFNLWQFHVDWSNPATSTFSQSSVPATAYTPGCYVANDPVNTVCVPEPSTATTAQSIDSVGDRFMYRFSYRNFGTYQSYLASHTIQTGSGKQSQTGIRWYELRGNGVPTIFQSGTISPDTTTYRFMPSITQDQNGNAAVGYSVSSATTHPGISASWWSLTNQTSPTEISLQAGSGDQENTYHWGDYTNMTVDPVDGCTFWYVNEYFKANQTGTGKPIWQTRVSSFSAPSCGAVTLAPSSLTFVAQAVGTTSPSQAVVLSNSQSTVLTINSIFGGGSDPSDFKQSNDCGSSVPAGASCTINISFAPTATGARTATLSVSDSASNSPQVVTLSGTGTSGPTITLSKSSVSFGNQAVGATSAPASVTVTNTGTATVTFSSIAVGGTNSSNFAESDNCVPTLVAGGTCTINVTFTPTSSSNFSAGVVLTDNAVGSPQSISLSGTGMTPVVLSSTTLGFGTVAVGSSKTAPAVTLTNEMSVALTGITISMAGSPAFTQVNTCGTTLAAGGQCKITVTFTPTASGSATGSVSIADSAVNSPQTIALTGVGQGPVTVAPVSLAFGTEKVGTSTAAKTVTVTNNLKTTLTFTSIAVGGTNAADYAISSKTCGSSLAAGATCTFAVTFTPRATGNRIAKVSLTDNAAGSPQTVKLSGVGD